MEQTCAANLNRVLTMPSDMVVCCDCRWAIAAIVLMKNSWLADDANVSMVSASLSNTPQMISDWHLQPTAGKQRMCMCFHLPDLACLMCCGVLLILSTSIPSRAFGVTAIAASKHSGGTR